MAQKNQYSFWYTGQVVNQANMQDLTDDLYNKFSQIVGTVGMAAPCILQLDGQITNNPGLINVPAGAFAFDEAIVNGLSTVIFGDADAADISVAPTDNGYIIATYTIPTTPNQTNYIVDVVYSFVAVLPASGYVVVCNVINGLFGGTLGAHYINTAATDADITSAINYPPQARNDVALTPKDIFAISGERAVKVATNPGSDILTDGVATLITWSNIRGSSLIGVIDTNITLEANKAFIIRVNANFNNMGIIGTTVTIRPTLTGGTASVLQIAEASCQAPSGQNAETTVYIATTTECGLVFSYLQDGDAASDIRNTILEIREIPSF